MLASTVGQNVRKLKNFAGALDQVVDDTSQPRAHTLVSTEDQLGRFHSHGVDKPPKRPKMRPLALVKCRINAVCDEPQCVHAQAMTVREIQLAAPKSHEKSCLEHIYLPRENLSRNLNKSCNKYCDIPVPCNQRRIAL